MGTDTEHDVDTLRIHHDMREQHIHLAAMKAMWFAAREFDAAHKVSTLLPTPACTSGQAGVGAVSDSVGQRTKHLPTDDTEGELE